MPRLRCLLLLLPLLALTGCVQFEEGSLAGAIFKEIGDAKVGDLIKLSIGWTILWGILGAVVGAVTFLVLKKAGAYRWEWKHSWIFVWTAGAMTVGAFGTAGAGVGFGEGFLRGSKVVLDESQLGTKVFPVLGNGVADACYVVGTVGAALEADPKAELTMPSLAGFREGSTTIDVNKLLVVAKNLPDDGSKNLGARLVADLVKKHPSMGGGNTERWLTQAVQTSFSMLAQKETAQGFKVFDKGIPGLGKVVKGLVTGLPAAAGSSGRMDRKALSDYVVHKGIVPTMMLPIRQYVRSQQIVFVALALFALLLPIGFFRLAEWIRARSAGPEAPPPAPSSGDPSVEAPDPPPAA